MPPSDDKRIDSGNVTLVWGDATRWKARLRDESLDKFAEKPLSERLRLALEMVARHKPDDPPR